MLDAVSNFGKVTLLQGYDSAATSVALLSGEGAKLPDPAVDGAYNLTWFNATDYLDPSDDASVEIVRVTAKSGDTLTITRAQEGTTATNKNLTGKTYKMVLAITKKMITDISAFGGRVETPTGTVDGSNATFTVSNEPKFIVVDGAVRFEGAGYSYSGGTITVDPLAPPTEYIRSIY